MDFYGYLYLGLMELIDFTHINAKAVRLGGLAA